MLFNIKCYQQLLTFFMSVCLLVLTGCVSTQSNSTLNENDDLMPYLDNLTLFVEQSLKNHPSLQYQPIQLLQRNGDGVPYVNSKLLMRISDHLVQNISANSHFNLVKADKNNHKNECIDQQAKFYLTLSFSQKLRGKFTSSAEFMRVEMNNSAEPVQLTPKISYQQDIYLSENSQKSLKINKQLLSHQQVIYDLNAVEETSKKLAYEFVCRYQLSKHSDMILIVNTTDERLNLVANEVNQQLASLLTLDNFSGVSIGNAKEANTQLQLTLYQNSNNKNVLLLKVYPILNTGEPLVDLSFELFVNKPKRVVAQGYNLVNTDNQKAEQLIEYLFAVAPDNYQDCNKTNPWQFGEQILPNSVKLPHYGCFAIKMGLHTRANTLLLTETAEGSLYRIDAEQCANKTIKSKLRTSFPTNYAKEQLVLELNQHQGVEHVVYLASEYSWDEEFLKMVDDLPLLCDEQPVFSNTRLDHVINMANKNKIDFRSIYIYH